MGHQFSYRLFRHHLPLLALTFTTVAFIYLTRPYKSVITRLSFATAYPAFILLSLTLIIGPVIAFQSWHNPVSNDLRRDLGIWAGIVALFHVVVGQCVHFRGQPWRYYLYGTTEKHTGLRHDLFGFANDTGMIATLLLLLLLATSSDLALRALGTARWKSLQRWNYAVFLLGALHAVAYQIGIEKQKWAWVAAVFISAVLTISLQAAGFLIRWRRERNGAKGSHFSSAKAKL